MVGLLLLLGFSVGSFLNVVILRHEAGEGIGGRSHCPACKRTLQWYELIPVVSYVMQRGRCRGCGTHVSLQYPLVELGTAALFLLVAYPLIPTPYTLPPTPSLTLLSTPLLNVSHLASLSSFVLGLVPLALHLIIWSLLLAITVYDLRTKLIPDRFSYSFAGLSLALIVLELTSSCSAAVCKLQTADFVAGPLLFLPFWALWKYSDGRWIGLGDGKLALGIGWFLGLEGGGSAVMFAFWIGAAVALVLLGIQHILARPSVRMCCRLPSANYTLRSEIPFGPFLVLGTAIVYFTGETILTLFG